MSVFCIVALITIFLLRYVKYKLLVLVSLPLAITLGVILYNNKVEHYASEVKVFDEIFSDRSKIDELYVHITEDPQLDHGNVDYIVKMSEIQIGENGEIGLSKGSDWVNEQSIRFIARAQKFPRFSIGDGCHIDKGSARVVRIGQDYRGYLMTERLSGIVEVADMRCSEDGKLGMFLLIRRNVYQIKNSLAKRVERSLYEPKASLLNGILFGDDRLFSDNFEQNLKDSGSTHLIAASGFNVNVAALSVETLLKRLLPLRVRIPFLLGGVWLFALFANLSGSIVRAALMFTIITFLKLIGRPINIFSVLVATLLVVLTLDPLYVANIGFLLSLAAVTGLVVSLPFLESIAEQVLKRAYQRKMIKNVTCIMLPSIACITFTIPISYIFFNSANYLTFFPNLILIPLVELVFTFGFIGLVSSFLGSASIFTFRGIDVVLGLFEFIITWSGQVLGGGVDADYKGSLSLLIGMSIIICSFFFSLKRSRVNNILSKV